MKKFIMWLVLSMSLSVPIIAQDCGTFMDRANVLNTNALASAVSALENAGAEVHYYTSRDLGTYANMDFLERGLEMSCPSWKNPDGIRKNNLIVFTVATSAHKMGVYYGSNFHKALDDSYSEIQNNYMKPKFRDNDFTGGFLSGSLRTVDHIRASKVISSGGPTVVEAPTDLSGLWSFLKWTGIIVGLSTIGFLVYWFFKNKAEDEKKRLIAQRWARSRKNTAIETLSNYEDNPNHDPTVLAKLQAILDRLTQSSLYDVEAMLPEADYTIIGQKYNDIIEALNIYNPKKTTPIRTNTSYRSKPVNRPDYSNPAPQTSNHNPNPSSNTIINNHYNEPNYIPYVAPYIPPVVIIEEPVYRRDSYRAPDPEPSYSSGGSDSWSSSDSGSGGSDSFSSSDSGGGGGSDW